MTQVEIDETNRLFMAQLIKRVRPGEIVGALVTVRQDAKGLGWYPVSPDGSATLLEMLRQEPDEVHVHMELRKK